MRARRKAQRVENTHKHHKPEVQLVPETIEGTSDIPASLLSGLQAVDNGNIPLLVPRLLEHFLTEKGLFASSMTPEEAWKTLKAYRDGGEPVYKDMPEATETQEE
jgi:hypothetical protein